MKKCFVKLDENVQKEMNKNIWILSLFTFIVGCVGLVSYIVIAYFFIGLWVDIYLVGMFVIFVFGLTFFICANWMNKKTLINNYYLEVEIYENYFVSITMNGEDVVASINIKYEDVVKFKETKNYFFMFLNKKIAVPILKSSFSKEDISTIKVWVNTSKLRKKKGMLKLYS